MVGIFLAPAVFLFGVDPYSLFVEYHNLRISKDFYFLYIIQQAAIYIIVQWCTLESTRVYITFLAPALIVFTLYIDCLNTIFTKSLNDAVISLYNQLYCINQAGTETLRTLMGLMFVSGFVLIVLGNWLVLAGWNIIPFEMYCAVLAMLLVCYFTIGETVPYAIRSNELSEAILHRWRSQVLGKKKQWIRIVRARRPIAFYYALTKFEKETQVNYYSNIVDYTVNLLLLI